MKGIKEWKFEVWKEGEMVDNGIVLARTIPEAKMIATQISHTQHYKANWQRVSANLYIKLHSRIKMTGDPFSYQHIRLFKEEK